MKLINFTAVEILPALLDKSKTQTIRKAWGDKLTCFWCQKKFKDLIKHTKKQHPKLNARSYDTLERPAKFKVGEKVQIMWTGDMTYLNKLMSCPREYIVGDLKKFSFGTVEITEVFQIEMNKITEFCEDKFFIRGKHIDSKALAKKDGFKSAEEMFKWFDKKYDLSTPKKFWVYRWKWI